jgi:hypothetical protein
MSVRLVYSLVQRLGLSSLPAPQNEAVAGRAVCPPAWLRDLARWPLRTL